MLQPLEDSPDVFVSHEIVAGLTVLPFWGGERNPGWADDARGAVVGLRLGTSSIAMLRACLEAIALRFATIDQLLVTSLPQVEPSRARYPYPPTLEGEGAWGGVGEPNRGEVIATGGALLHSPAWMQIIADALGRPVLASAEAEASSRGAALLPLEAVGALDEPLEGLRPASTTYFEPVPEHTQRYRAAAERQRRLYDALIT